MKIQVVPDKVVLGKVAAREIARQVKAKPNLTILTATGFSQVETFDELAKLKQRDQLDVSRIRLVQLDENVGISRSDRRSFYRWLLESLIEPLGISDAQVVHFDLDLKNPIDACRKYDEEVARIGGLDLNVLGLGVGTCHVGGHEPPSSADAPTRVVPRAPETIASCAAYWGSVEDVPLEVMTCGMTHLLTARRTLLLVSGAHKAPSLKRVCEGQVGPDAPATYFRRAADFAIIADRAAAALLRH